jgi:hypothetical protein
MNDQISRQEAIESIRKIKPWKKVALWDAEAEKVRDFYFIDKEKAQTELMMLPSAQSEVLAHGVVKCRECKYSAMIYSTNMTPVVGGFEVEGICHIFCQCDKFGGIEMRWDDFCSRAERRTDASTNG